MRSQIDMETMMTKTSNRRGGPTPSGSNTAKARSPKVRQFKRAHIFEVTGASAPDRLKLPWVHVRACGREAWLPLADFTANKAGVRLAEAGIVLLRGELTRLVEQVERLKRFPTRPLLERPGWTKGMIALPDGQVFGPASDEPRVVLYATQDEKCAAAGNLDAWLEGIDEAIAPQRVAAFVLMFAFAAPLLDLTDRLGNYGFELAGPKGRGKSTLQQLAASVIGPAVRPSGANYWTSANATANGLEDVMAFHSDLPMILEETNLFAAGETAVKRAGKINELVFRLSAGSTKTRHGAPTPKHYRFIWLTSTNEPLIELLGDYHSEVASAAADRLLTIPIALERKLGVFDVLPPGFTDSGALAKHLTHLIAANHGVAMPRYLQGLTEHRARDEAGLRAQIAMYMGRFRSKVGVDANDGSATRVADAFGLVYAAGKLAQAYGALPRSLKCLAAAQACYDLNRSTSVEGLPVAERLLTIAKDARTRRVDPQQLTVISDDTLATLPALIRRNPQGQDELLFTRPALERAFPAVSVVFKDPVAKRMLAHDETRKTVKRAIRRNKPPERVYCFRLH